MFEFLEIFPRRFRLLFAAVLAGGLLVANLLLFSVLATELQTHHIRFSLSEWTSGTSSLVSVTTAQATTPNVVTTGVDKVAGEAQRITSVTGNVLSGVGRGAIALPGYLGRATLHGSAVALRYIGHGTLRVARIGATAIAFPFRMAADGIIFTVRLPGKLVSSITHTHAVDTIIRPADSLSTPVIDSETSAAVLSHLNADQQQEIAKLQAAQLAANQALDGTIVAGDPNHGGYPAKWDNAPQDSATDSWGMYNRECVSYAAWKVYQTYGSMPYWGGIGNANEWVRDARAAGIPTGTTPVVHSVAISVRGYYGHAMWVEKVSGNMIYVSQYNYDLRGHYSEMWVNGNSLTYIYFK